MRRTVALLLVVLAAAAISGVDPASAQVDCGWSPADSLASRATGDEVTLVFREDALPCMPFPSSITDEDRIAVHMVLTANSSKDYAVELVGEVKGDGVSLLGMGTNLPGFRPNATDSLLFNFGSFGPFSAPKVIVRVTHRDGAGREDLKREYVFRVRRTYVGGLQFGVGRARFPLDDFAVRGGVIRNIGEEKGDLRPMLLMTLYSWRFWEKNFWRGRDVEEARDLLGRIDPVIGLGTDDLWKEYVAGVSAEVARGFSVWGGGHFVEVEALAEGLVENGPFSGTDTELTVRQKWEEDWIIGLSLDLRIVAAALQSVATGTN